MVSIFKTDEIHEFVGKLLQIAENMGKVSRIIAEHGGFLSFDCQNVQSFVFYKTPSLTSKNLDLCHLNYN